MTTPQKNLPKVPPFVERKTKPKKQNGLDTRGMLSLATMLVSLAALTVSMLGAGRLILDIFNEGLANNLDGIFVKLLALSLTFLFGWATGLASIRGFGNLVYSYVINIYAWACLIAVSVLYIKVIQKLFMQEYEAINFWAYLILLLGGLMVLFFLHLLVEDHDLRPFAIPMLIISVVQLFMIVVRYVFTNDAEGLRIFADFGIFFTMVTLATLMLLHIGIFSPLREQINGLFMNNNNGDHNEE
ncbi:MAG TPA: hypothetical protein PLF42_09275 [Anaerolineales bacterium]|nr:hypothetical protein [Anaerolineales bacterium]